MTLQNLCIEHQSRYQKPLPTTIPTDCILRITTHHDNTHFGKVIIIPKNTKCINSHWKTFYFFFYYLYFDPFFFFFFFQEHVGEYGVHWNFFFTLAAVSILTHLTPIPPSQSGWAGGVILVGEPPILYPSIRCYIHFFVNIRMQGLSSKNSVCKFYL